MRTSSAHNDKYSRSAASLTRVAFEGNLGYAMSSWLSVVYSLSVTRDPAPPPNP